MIDVLHREHTGVATALTVRLQVVSAGSGRPLHGRSVRLWHCSSPVEVRISDESGWTEFDGLLPTADPGRWPHLHFEIHGHTGRLTLPGAGEFRRTEMAEEPLMMASVTGDVRRGLVATRMISTPGRG